MWARLYIFKGVAILKFFDRLSDKIFGGFRYDDHEHFVWLDRQTKSTMSTISVGETFGQWVNMDNMTFYCICEHDGIQHNKDGCKKCKCEKYVIQRDLWYAEKLKEERQISEAKRIEKAI